MPDFRLFEYQVKGVPEFRLRFEKLGAGIKDFRFLWPRIAERFYQIERDQFAAEGRKSKWAKLSPGYAKWKQAHFPGKPILQREGFLVASLTSRTAGSIYESAPLKLVLGTSIPYGAVHQRGKHLPERPPIDMTPDDIRGVGNILQKGFEEIASKAGFKVAGLAA